MADRAAVERRALADELQRLRSDYEGRLAVIERHILMLQASVKQLQDLFAVRAVERGSGPTEGPS